MEGIDIATVLAQARDVTVRVENGVNGWQIAATIGTCLAAIASWRAATASHATSRDARRALGLSTRPNIGTRYLPDGATLVAGVQNYNQYAAADLSIDVHLRDGGVRSDKLDRLGEAPGPMSKIGPSWTVRIDNVLSGEPHVPIGMSIDYAAVRWCDAQRIVQWEELTTFYPEGGQKQEDRLIGDMPHVAVSPVRRWSWLTRRSRSDSP